MTIATIALNLVVFTLVGLAANFIVMTLNVTAAVFKDRRANDDFYDYIMTHGRGYITENNETACEQDLYSKKGFFLGFGVFNLILVTALVIALPLKGEYVIVKNVLSFYPITAYAAFLAPYISNTIFGGYQSYVVPTIIIRYVRDNEDGSTSYRVALSEDSEFYEKEVILELSEEERKNGYARDDVFFMLIGYNGYDENLELLQLDYRDIC